MRTRYVVAAHFAGEWDEPRVRRWAETTRARLEAPSVTFGIVFMSPQFFEVASEVLEVLRVHARIPLLAGCSSQSLIANGEELEDQAGLVLQLFHLPDATVRAVRFDQEQLESLNSPLEWPSVTGVPRESVRGWMVFADPFHLDAESWLRSWHQGYGGVPVVGGLASGLFEPRRTQVYLDGEVFEEGGVALGVGGAVKIESMVSQGCTPIGAPWTITKADRNLILTIANRPAYSVLQDTFQGLSEDEQRRAQRNLFVGFASSEYREEFRHGDFLVRNLLGADENRGILAVGALPRTGQTIQFHRRDAESASADLSGCLAEARRQLHGRIVYGGVLSVCNGRGRRLFGRPSHDAGLIQEQLGPLPVAGFFCNGELGPVGGHNFLHGYTASLGLLVRD
ncbi:MAG: FIST C-terminal domain-containing protein [Verrucomicrobia bacterium]|nr:FIST C-terminal domain-containing protein [Verrucomicrobiota bacterium]